MWPRLSARARIGLRASARRRARARKCSRSPGKITNTGLIEVPMGTTLRQIVEKMGGGAPGRRQDQSCPDGRPFGRLHPRRGAGYAGGLRLPDQARLHHGLGRHDRHGRHHEDGGRRPVLHGVLHGRIVRQMHSLPGRHGADAWSADEDPGAQSHRARPARSSKSCARW